MNNIINIDEEIYKTIVLPNTSELLYFIYNIINLIKNKIVRNNVCNNKYLIVIYKIINNHYNKIEDEYKNLKNKEYLYIYENAKLFLNTIKVIIIQLDKTYFHIDLDNAYYYYYNMCNNNIETDIYNKNYNLLQYLYSYINSKINSKINKDLIDNLNKLEINSYYYDNIYNYINNISINPKEILENFKITNELIKSSITLQQIQKKNINEIIENKNKKLKERNIESDKICNLELALKEPTIKKEKNILFNEIVFEITINEDETNYIKDTIYNKDEEDNIKEFKENLIKTFENNNNIFLYNKENKKIIKNNFNKYYDNGKFNIINNYNNNSIASLFLHFLSNDKKLILCDNDRYSIINYNDNVRELGIDLGNIRKKFIQSLINELFEKEIFINDKRENNNKYFLNSNYKADETFNKLIEKYNKSYYDKIKNNDNQFIQDFYNFISNLITFLLFTNYNIEKEISSYLISNYYKSSYSDYDYIYYLLKDFNNHHKTQILNILKIDNENINYSDLVYNNNYLLNENIEEETINSRNNINYITDLAKFLSLKTIEKTKNKDIINRGELINKTFINSIPDDIKIEFNKIKNINNTIINNLLINNDMNIDEFKENFYNNMIFSIKLMRDENINYKILNETKIIILANILKLFFINNLFELYKNNNNNYKLKISINNYLPNDNIGKFYSNINKIEFPDYFNDNEDNINIIFNDITSINENDINLFKEKYIFIFDKIENFFNYINPVKVIIQNEEIKGGRRRSKNECQLYIDNKSYFIMHNNKKHYLTINNIMRRNNNLFIKIDKKYIKIIF